MLKHQYVSGITSGRLSSHSFTGNFDSFQPRYYIPFSFQMELAFETPFIKHNDVRLTQQFGLQNITQRDTIFTILPKGLYTVYPNQKHSIGIIKNSFEYSKLTPYVFFDWDIKPENLVFEKMLSQYCGYGKSSQVAINTDFSGKAILFYIRNDMNAMFSQYKISGSRKYNLNTKDLEITLTMNYERHQFGMNFSLLFPQTPLYFEELESYFSLELRKTNSWGKNFAEKHTMYALEYMLENFFLEPWQLYALISRRAHNFDRKRKLLERLIKNESPLIAHTPYLFYETCLLYSFAKRKHALLTSRRD